MGLNLPLVPEGQTVLGKMSNAGPDVKRLHSLLIQQMLTSVPPVGCQATQCSGENRQLLWSYAEDRGSGQPTQSPTLFHSVVTILPLKRTEQAVFIKHFQE